jgi:single-strand DNA-binding protein
MDYNKAIISGRLTRDPDFRTLPSGDAKCSFTVATNRVYKDADGDKQEQTEFHNMVAYRRNAEVVHQFAHKGSTILVDGHLSTRSYEDKDGVRRYTTEIIAESVRLGPKSAKPAEEAPVIASEEAAPTEVPF